MEECSVHDSEYLHVKRILCSEKLYVSVLLIVLNTLCKICSNQIRIMSLRVCEFSKFSFTDALKLSIYLIWNNFGNCVSS